VLPEVQLLLTGRADCKKRLKQERADHKKKFENPELSIKTRAALAGDLARIEDKLGGLLSKLFSIVRLVGDLIQLSTGLNSNGTMKLFFPISVCTSLRMFNQGSSNLINNKNFRLLAIPSGDVTSITPEADEIYRFYLTVQKTKVRGLSEALPKKQIEYAQVDETFRDPFKFTFYRDKYLSGESFLIWVDATASVMQIYSLLFGDAIIAKRCNLLGGEYRDVYTDLIQEMPKPAEGED